MALGILISPVASHCAECQDQSQEATVTTINDILAEVGKKVPGFGGMFVDEEKDIGRSVRFQRLNNPHPSSTRRVSSFLDSSTCMITSRGTCCRGGKPNEGYPNGNTAEGDGALNSLTPAGENTAIGFQALFANTFGFENTANGNQALFANTTS